MTCCLKGCSNWSRLNKNASCNKVLCEEFKFFKKTLNSYIRAKPQLLEKSFVKNRIKTENIFLHNSVKILGNFNIKHL